MDNVINFDIMGWKKKFQTKIFRRVFFLMKFVEIGKEPYIRVGTYYRNFTVVTILMESIFFFRLSFNIIVKSNNFIGMQFMPLISIGI